MVSFMVPFRRNHPADSQDLGIENSAQPQSKQTWTFGEGDIGG
jgi:hypothetical protein